MCIKYISTVVTVYLHVQVTGDNVCSLALCDYNGDGENEVHTYVATYVACHNKNVYYDKNLDHLFKLYVLLE